MGFIGGKRSIAYLDAYTKEQTDELLDPESVHSPLGTAAVKNAATEAEALAGTAGVLPDAEQVRSVIAQDVPSATTETAGRVEKATNQEALEGAADKYPDAAGVHSAIRGLAVGTVSQSGGVPTGAIIESGSNVNGEYVKYADGTLICTVARPITGGWAIGTELDRGWGFPIEFAANPIVLPVVYGGYSAGNGIAQLEKTISPVYVIVNVRNNTAVNIGVGGADIEKFTAIGRWY